MKLIAIKTNDGYYISDNYGNQQYYSSNLDKYKFDGEKPLRTFHKDWMKVLRKPQQITESVPQPDTNKRYELKEKDIFKQLKEMYLEEEVLLEEACSENDYTRQFTEDFDKIKSLYEFKSDKQEPIDNEVEFEFIEIAHIDEIKSPETFSYEVQKTNWSHEGTTFLTDNDLKRDKLQEIITPSLLLHTKPVRLSSKQTFDIIRQFVKNNINSSVAEITSDYNFCFTVKKRIKLAEKQAYTIDINNNLFNRKKRRPKLETRFQETRSVQIFEMTHSEENYKGYTVIEGFKGENVEELKENIDVYLEELITKINEPLEECACCKGRGVILNQ